MAYGNWDQFGNLRKLDFVIHGTDQNDVATVYANSRHMLQIIVTVEVFDKTEKNKLNITDDEISKALYFCHADTGNTLGSPWTISDNPGEYVTNGDGHDKNESSNTDPIRYIYKYISCNPHNLSDVNLKETISVGIDVPGVGKFNTTHNGTTTKGHTFREPKVYKIVAEPPIDYANHDNLTIESGAFELLANDLKYTSRLTTEGPLKDHSDGECKRRIVSIKPNKSKINIDKFKKHEIVYDPIVDTDVSTDSLWWWWGDAENDPYFSLLKNSNGKPCAVIGQDYEAAYQLNLWFSRQNNVNIDSRFYVVDSNYYYRFNAKISHNHIGEDEKGAATLVCYKFRMPLYAYKYYWKSVIREVKVNVTDFFGNEGTFKLAFDEKDHFDEPGLV